MRRPLLLSLALAAAFAGCGDDRGTAPVASTPEIADAYRLTIRSSQGSTDAMRASICGEPTSELVELPCAVSLGFARQAAPRLYVWRERDRLAIDLERPASGVWISFGEDAGEDGLTRRSALVRLSGTGQRFEFGGSTRTAGWPTVERPRWLSVLVAFEDDMPLPNPVPSGAPEDAVVAGASAEYLVQLATRARADVP